MQEADWKVYLQWNKMLIHCSVSCALYCFTRDAKGWKRSRFTMQFFLIFLGSIQLWNGQTSLKLVFWRLLTVCPSHSGRWFVPWFLSLAPSLLSFHSNLMPTYNWGWVLVPAIIARLEVEARLLELLLFAWFWNACKSLVQGIHVHIHKWFMISDPKYSACISW